MCGLFGAFGNVSAVSEALVGVAAAASTRGPHAHGYVHATGGKAHAVRRIGPVGAVTLRELRALRGEAVVGHARLATTGATAHANLDEVQPLPALDLFVAHNGRVPDHTRVAENFGLEPRTGNDSEVLGLLVASRPGDRSPERLRAAVEAALAVLGTDVPGAGLFFAPATGALVVARWGQPLYVQRHSAALILCSQPFMGGEELPDLCAHAFHVQEGAYKALGGVPLPRRAPPALNPFAGLLRGAGG